MVLNPGLVHKLGFPNISTNLVGNLIMFSLIDYYLVRCIPVSGFLDYYYHTIGLIKDILVDFEFMKVISILDYSNPMVVISTLVNSKLMKVISILAKFNLKMVVSILAKINLEKVINILVVVVSNLTDYFIIIIIVVDCILVNLNMVSSSLMK